MSDIAEETAVDFISQLAQSGKIGLAIAAFVIGAILSFIITSLYYTKIRQVQLLNMLAAAKSELESKTDELSQKQDKIESLEAICKEKSDKLSKYEETEFVKSSLKPDVPDKALEYFTR